MLPRIEQEISERVTHFSRRLERVHVIAILDHLLFAIHETVQSSCDPNVQPRDGPSQCNSILGLDHNVDVVTLNRKMAQAHPQPLAGQPERLLDGREALALAEAYHIGTDSNGHVLGLTSAHFGTRHVRELVSVALATRSFALSTPASEYKRLLVHGTTRSLIIMNS